MQISAAQPTMNQHDKIMLQGAISSTGTALGEIREECNGVSMALPLTRLLRAR
jgi:hypothetical protein